MTRPEKSAAFPYHGSSMRGTFRESDILLVAPIAAEAVCPGDVIAFRRIEPNGSVSIVAHRVQNRTTAGLITRGDCGSAPDRNPVRTETLIGRVCHVQRCGRTRRVWGGRVGRFWAGYLRLRRRVVRLGQWPYRLLRASGVLRHLWRPRLVRVHLTNEDGPTVKYLHGRRIVAQWWPEKGHFWCRKPYDLVVEHPNKVVE